MRCSLSSCPQWDLEPRASFFCATLLVSESTLIYLLFLREVLLSRIWEFTAGFWSWLQPKDIQSLGLQSKHRWTVVVSFVTAWNLATYQCVHWPSLPAATLSPHFLFNVCLFLLNSVSFSPGSVLICQFPSPPPRFLVRWEVECIYISWFDVFHQPLWCT